MNRRNFIQMIGALAAVVHVPVKEILRKIDFGAGVTVEKESDVPKYEYIAYIDRWIRLNNEIDITPISMDYRNDSTLLEVSTLFEEFPQYIPGPIDAKLICEYIISTGALVYTEKEEIFERLIDRGEKIPCSVFIQHMRFDFDAYISESTVSFEKGIMKRRFALRQVNYEHSTTVRQTIPDDMIAKFPPAPPSKKGYENEKSNTDPVQ